MNTAINYTDLPPKEREVADMYVYGFTKKEISYFLSKPIRTVENQIRSLYTKTEVHKDTEFARWYFCSRFNISFDLSPLKRQIAASCLLALIATSIFFDNNLVRIRTSRARITMVKRASRKNEA